ncbi:MAG: hypothetical protein IKS20_10235 [Victivallales bacterium]|nr:hypothetical protein [Victivallales bacterium]
MILMVIGIVVYLIGAIGLLIDEFKEHIAWGLLGLFTQIGHLIFALCHFDKCKKSLGIILLGIILIIIGAVISGGAG